MTVTWRCDMSNFTISVEVMAGTSVGDAVQEAKDMCIKLDVALSLIHI